MAIEIPIKRKPFFYGNQIRRYLVQLLAKFSGYQVQYGTQADGTRPLRDVPIIYGDHSFVVASILAGANNNTMPSLPIMSLYMTGLRQDDERRTTPQHFETQSYVERKRDPDGNLLVNQPGRKVTIERWMPVPYDMDIEVAIWASNSDELFQLLEQILVVFNPELDLLISNSPIDWTFLTTLIFKGDVNIDEIVPLEGTNQDPMYKCTLPFHLVIHLSVPVKKYDTKVIHEVHVDIEELRRQVSDCREIDGMVDFDQLPEIDGLVIRAKDADISFFESLK